MSIKVAINGFGRIGRLALVLAVSVVWHCVKLKKPKVSKSLLLTT